ANLVKILPFLASEAPFLRLMVDHLLCPDMFPLPYHKAAGAAQTLASVWPASGQALEGGGAEEASAVAHGVEEIAHGQRLRQLVLRQRVPDRQQGVFATLVREHFAQGGHGRAPAPEIQRGAQRRDEGIVRRE